MSAEHAATGATTVANLDGSSTAYFDMECTEARLLELLREVFEKHWAQVIFGPCIEGAVFEGRFAERPKVTLLDGYVTVQVAGSESWHFHLCIGPHRGSPGLPTPPALAEWRRCARASRGVKPGTRPTPATSRGGIRAPPRGAGSASA